jgi:hypothetical protein
MGIGYTEWQLNASNAERVKKMFLTMKEIAS